MDDIKLVNLWNSYDEKFNESFSLLKNNLEDVSRLKVKSFLSSMTGVKIFTLIVGILWVGIGGYMVLNLFLFAYTKVSHFFLYSAVLQLLLTGIAVVIYLYQLILIHQVDISDPVLKTQETLVRLKTSTLWVTRILILQAPVWTTFYLNGSLIRSGNISYLLINSLVTLLFLLISIWFFYNIKYENRHKKWFRIIFDGREWLPLLKSMELLEEINEYKHEGAH